MEQYKFRLQKLLDIRLDKEEQSKVIFKEAQREKEQAESTLQNLKDNYKKHHIVTPEATLIEQKIRQNYLNALSQNINRANVELLDKCRKLDERREELKQKQIERKTVEILKEKQKLQFYKEQELIEQRNNDEFALYGFIRTREGR